MSKLSALLGVHPASLRRMAALGQLPLRPLAFGARTAFARTAVEQWLNGSPTAESLAPEQFRLLTTAAAAELLGVSRASAYRHLPGLVEAVIVVTERRYPVCRLLRVVAKSRGWHAA